MALGIKITSAVRVFSDTSSSYVFARIHSELVFHFSHRLHYFSHTEKQRKASCMNKSWIKSPPTGQRWSGGQWRSNKHNGGSYLNVRGRPVASGYVEKRENKRRQKQTKTPLEADPKTWVRAERDQKRRERLPTSPAPAQPRCHSVEARDCSWKTAQGW